MPSAASMLSSRRPGLAHERLAARIFLGAGRLADEQPLGCAVAHAGHRLVARPAQPARRARVDVRGERVPRRGARCARSRVGAFGRVARRLRARVRSAARVRTRAPAPARAPQARSSRRATSSRRDAQSARISARRHQAPRSGADDAPHDERILAPARRRPAGSSSRGARRARIPRARTARSRARCRRALRGTPARRRAAARRRRKRVEQLAPEALRGAHRAPPTD